jgi:hypothetical protein
MRWAGYGNEWIYRIWKEAVLVYFKALRSISLERLRKTTKPRARVPAVCVYLVRTTVKSVSITSRENKQLL